jgi:hypothetical protein
MAAIGPTTSCSPFDYGNIFHSDCWDFGTTVFTPTLVAGHGGVSHTAVALHDTSTNPFSTDPFIQYGMFPTLSVAYHDN